METNNQLNNERSNQNSTVVQTKLDCELKFKMNFEIKDQLIVVLNEFTSLLYGDKNKAKVIEKANSLMHDLVDLPLKIDHIRENEINSTNDHLLKPTLIIDSKMKLEIIELLIKNKSYYSLFKDNKDDKLNLINKNNNFVIKLMQYPIEMLKVDYRFNGIEKNNQSNCIDLTNDQVDQQITNPNKRIRELEGQIANLCNNLGRITKEAKNLNKKTNKKQKKKEQKQKKPKVPNKKQPNKKIVV